MSPFTRWAPLTLRTFCRPLPNVNRQIFAAIKLYITCNKLAILPVKMSTFSWRDFRRTEKRSSLRIENYTENKWKIFKSLEMNLFVGNQRILVFTQVCFILFDFCVNMFMDLFASDPVLKLGMVWRATVKGELTYKISKSLWFYSLLYYFYRFYWSC